MVSILDTVRHTKGYFNHTCDCARAELCLAILVHDEPPYKRMRHAALPIPEDVAVKSHNTLAKAASPVVRGHEG
jgi:hypothetical protein